MVIQVKKTGGQQNNPWNSGIIYKIAAALILLGFLVGAYNANRSYAWFTDKNDSAFTLESGKVHYEVNYTAENGLMVPGKNLFSSFTLTNKSSIDTDVRFQIQYTVWEDGGTGNVTSSTAIYITNGALSAPQDDQYLNLSLKTGDGGFALQKVTDSGIMAGEWWTRTARVPAVTESALQTGEPVEVFTEDNGSIRFCYDGPKTENVFAGLPVRIVIRLQAKQSDHVEWADLTMVETFGAAE